jgi:tripartite-type tricarboxylate transporter receptor subunit TctC
MARIIGKKLTEMWGQQVLVDSRPGAAGAVGMEFAAKQAPDGYTFLLGNFGPVLANPLLNKVKYDVDKEFVPVSQITRAANILVIPNTLPVKNVRELVALAKKNPGMTYATSGPGSMSHLIGEMFRREAKVDITTVPYQGGVFSIAAVQGGHIMMMFSDAPPVMGNLKAGKLKALAVTSAERTPFTPELPTLAEQGVRKQWSIRCRPISARRCRMPRSRRTSVRWRLRPCTARRNSLRHSSSRSASAGAK